MIKIKSINDIITNSSSEVFIILLPIDCTDSKTGLISFSPNWKEDEN